MKMLAVLCRNLSVLVVVGQHLGGPLVQHLSGPGVGPGDGVGPGVAVVDGLKLASQQQKQGPVPHFSNPKKLNKNDFSGDDGADFDDGSCDGCVAIVGEDVCKTIEGHGNCAGCTPGAFRQSYDIEVQGKSYSVRDCVVGQWSPDESECIICMVNDMQDKDYHMDQASKNLFTCGVNNRGKPHCDRICKQCFPKLEDPRCPLCKAGINIQLPPHIAVPVPLHFAVPVPLHFAVPAQLRGAPRTEAEYHAYLQVAGLQPEARPAGPNIRIRRGYISVNGDMAGVVNMDVTDYRIAAWYQHNPDGRLTF